MCIVKTNKQREWVLKVLPNNISKLKLIVKFYHISGTRLYIIIAAESVQRLQLQHIKKTKAALCYIEKIQYFFHQSCSCQFIHTDEADGVFILTRTFGFTYEAFSYSLKLKGKAAMDDIWLFNIVRHYFDMHCCLSKYR